MLTPSKRVQHVSWITLVVTYIKYALHLREELERKPKHTIHTVPLVWLGVSYRTVLVRSQTVSHLLPN